MRRVNELRTTAEELGIRSICARDAGEAWVHGELGMHHYLALVFHDQPAEPHHALDKTRISKLWIREINSDKTVLHYERGWVVYPVSYGATHLLFRLAHDLANVVFPRLEAVVRD